MKSASLKEIKAELKELEPETLTEICIRLARYKKENKELLSYLLFEANDEASYVEAVKTDLADFFNELPKGNVYYIKKSLRKVLRFANRQIRYSEEKETEIEIRLEFCRLMKAHHIPMPAGTILFNLYQQQVKKITGLIAKLPEDVQADYDLKGIR